MSDRDTQFQGFAKLLYEDFLRLAREDESTINEMFSPGYPEQWRTKVEERIAQRAYDFACHIATYTLLHAHGDMHEVPDMTSWHLPFGD